MKKSTLLVLLIIATLTAIAQPRAGYHLQATGNIELPENVLHTGDSTLLESKLVVGIEAPRSAASAAIEFTDTDRGVLLSRVTTAQRDAIASPDSGLIVFNLSTQAFNYYNGSSWAVLGASGVGNTLDQAYDQGGSGAGRTITADAGAVEITGNFKASNSDYNLINDTANLGAFDVPISGTWLPYQAGVWFDATGDYSSIGNGAHSSLIGYQTATGNNRILVKDSSEINITADTLLTLNSTIGRLTLNAQDYIGVDSDADVYINSDLGTTINSQDTTNIISDNLISIFTENAGAKIDMRAKGIGSFISETEMYLTTDDPSDDWEYGITSFGANASCCANSTTVFALYEPLQLDVNVLNVTQSYINLQSKWDTIDGSNFNMEQIQLDNTGISLQHGIPGGSSTPVSVDLDINDNGVEITTTGGAFYPPDMTAANASAITASDGAIVYVTDTDGTFTSIGFWGKVNGTWEKLD